ncbi:30S ribosomal protein S17 [Candidatus Omnitrophota bacterium]
MKSKARRKERIGIVVNDKMDKGAVVRIDRTAKHPIYGRIMKKSSKVKIMDVKKEAKVGNKVRVQETRPLSKDKRWRLVEILK